MKVGLAISDVDCAVRDARAAEELGFDYVASGEHLFFHGPTPNAFVQLAAAAGATTTIRLVSSIALLPLYPPALAAKLAASLDRVSNGRFEFGVGSGGEYPPEFEAVGVDLGTRFRRVDEALEVLQRLFTGERVSFDGEFTVLRDVALDPPPLRPGGPRIWLGGRQASAVRRAGRFADVWMPYMVDPARMHKSLQQVRVAAIDAGRDPDVVSGAVFLWTCVDEDGEWARRTGIARVSATYAQDFTPIADRYLALGTPAEVVARFQEFADAGVDTVLIQIAAEPAEQQRVIATVARDVLPHLRSKAVTG
jgi:probable F420-dependent oxidoreductase